MAKDICVLHKCDIPSCVNPEHLFLGTRQDNTADMMKKGRYVKGRTHRGEKNHLSKLTDAQVIAIRKDNRPLKEIAADYGTHFTNVSDIKRRKTWRHI